MSLAADSPVQVIVRVRLAPCLPLPDFERWLRTIPSVLYAALITGDADYEVQVNCDSFAGLGDALTMICGGQGVQVASTALILHEVSGLGLRRQAVPDEVTLRRLSTM
jgi:hypothetical protein